MATNDFLEAEARERPRVAGVAALAGVLTLAAPLVVQVAVSGQSADNSLTAAILQSEHRAAVLLSAACSVLGLLGITYVLDFLLRATGSRVPELPSFIRPLLIVGGVGLAVFTGALQVISTFRIEHFATEGSQTWSELEQIRSYGPAIFIGIVAQFSFAGAFVLVVLNAMRSGLLTRFLGYLGAFSAILFVFPILPLPIVQLFWLGALAAMFAGIGRAPLPPAWPSGEAIAWPSGAELREQRVRAAEERRAARGGQPAPEPEPAGPEPSAPDDEGADDAGQPAGGLSPAASRRKRKKRR